MNKKISDIPVLPLRGVTIFPEMIMHFDVGREKSLRALDEAMKQNELILAVAQKDADVDEPSRKDLYTIGTVVQIRQMAKIGEGQFKVLVKGTARARILDIEESDYLSAKIEIINEEALMEKDIEQAIFILSAYCYMSFYIKAS